jgi:hypothetical protein
MGKLYLIVAACILTIHRADAFPASQQDGRDFAAKLRQARLARPGTDATKANAACKDAQSLARRFDANDFWLAQVEECFAAVAEIERDKVAACDRYAAAAEKYAKVRNDAKIRSVEPDIERTAKAHARLSCPNAIAMLPANAAGPLTAKGLNEIVARVTAARIQLIQNGSVAARATCDEARHYAARFAAYAYAAGVVEECFADIDAFEKNKGMACTHYQTAATLYARTGPNEQGVSQAGKQVARIGRIRAKLGC